MIPIKTNNIKPSDVCASFIIENNLLHKPKVKGSEAKVLKEQALVVIKDKWNILKIESHPVIQNRMTDIENKLALSCPLDKRDSFLTEKIDALFRKLANVFGASQFFGNTIPVDSVSYHQLLQKWEDEALLVLWNKGVVAQLGNQVLAYISAQDIRAYLTDPTNTPLLQQITSLDLSDSELKVIPPEIQNFPNLKNLVLSNNKISDLGAIVNCTQLQSLYLCNNQIPGLPEAIGNLTQLRRLVLDDNRIPVIPKGIGNCILLDSLHLNNNQIQVIPKEIGDLILLQYLCLTSNQISNLPDPAVIGNLNRLIKLDLSNNQITHISDDWLQCRKLCLDNNPILFVYDTSPLPESLMDIKPIVNPCMAIKPIFDAFKDYDCRSAFSRFFKLVTLKPESQEGIKETFKQLKPEDQNLISAMVYAEAGVNDLQWDEHHVFDSMPIFYRALKKTVSAKFDCLFPEERNNVYDQLHKLACRPVGSPAEWDEQHAFENVLRLIDAMDLANV